jgi:hypothetical protein
MRPRGVARSSFKNLPTSKPVLAKGGVTRQWSRYGKRCVETYSNTYILHVAGHTHWLENCLLRLTKPEHSYNIRLFDFLHFL